MVSSVTRVGQRKTIICAITSLIFVVTHLPFSLQGTQHNRKPQHKHLEKDHSASLYMYTKSILQPVNLNFKSANRTGKPKETFESRSLYSFLTEGIQILKHNQVTCVRTHFKAETLLHLNISNKQVRFSTFMLGSDEWNFARNISCFEVHTCFGADITYYSALKQNNQVLIPPYEIFKVTDIQTETKECRITLSTICWHFFAVFCLFTPPK
uniref:NAD(P)(+)--arginine ADP-ribosyltransferase n=1 Tax=Oreochromis niloticus TaxID=8128 RepID=A0A669C338_ORENI